VGGDLGMVWRCGPLRLAGVGTLVVLSAMAKIEIDKTDGSPTGAVNEPVSIQPKDTDGFFRIVDCKYMYNLATSSLSGANAN
jgi:hypothetical protein